MAFAFQCPQCGRRHRVDEAMAGRRARCSCGAVMTVPAPLEPRAGGGLIVVRCPGCSRTHKISAQMAGRSARCSCGTILQIAGPAASATPTFAEPTAVASVLDEITAADRAPPPTAPEPAEATARRSDDEVLASYLRDESWKKPSSTDFFTEFRDLVDMVVPGGGFTVLIVYLLCPPIVLILALIAFVRWLLNMFHRKPEDCIVSGPARGLPTAGAGGSWPASAAAPSRGAAARPWLIGAAIVGGTALACLLGLVIVLLFLGVSKAIVTVTASPPLEQAGEDYAAARAAFRTNLQRRAGSPQLAPALSIPSGAEAVAYRSGSYTFTAMVDPDPGDRRRHPAVVFLHGGFAFGPEDWTMAQAYRDAGYIVMIPVLRGENGQSGSFTLFFAEVDDVLAATDALARLRYVDGSRIYVAGHSAGGTLAVLAAMTSSRYRAAASLSGTMNQRTLIAGCPELVVFDAEDEREIQVRSPEAYATSFKCPARLYYGDREAVLAVENRRTANRAREAGLDVQAVEVPGGHLSAVEPAMGKSIEFFRKEGAL